MHVTVAICTWNRAKLLDQTLTHMRNLRIPEGVTWELLVVNNNCTDDTDAVLNTHLDALPLRRLLESKQGLSNARNCAIAAATGELLLWTDDDVLVDPEWLAAYAAAAAAFPEADLFGGEIEPWFEQEPPRWILENLTRLHGPFAIAQRTAEIRPLQPGEFPIGANMGLRLSRLRQFCFSPQLGRVGDHLISGDEKDLCSRIIADGHSGIWVGTARVRHYIPASRMTFNYLWAWFYGGGKTEVRMGKFAGGPMLGKAPRWVWRKYLEETLKRIARSFRRDERWFLAFRNSAILSGVIDEFRGR